MPGIDEQSESSVARSDRSHTEASSIDLEWEHEAGTSRRNSQQEIDIIDNNVKKVQ